MMSEPETAPENQISLRLLYAGMKLSGRILDVGCNTGFLTNFLDTSQKLNYWGIDANPEYIKLAQTRYGGDWSNAFKVVDFVKQGLPFPDTEYDSIFCGEVVEHLEVEQTKALLKEIYRVLKPGGYFLITTPAPILTEHTFNPDHKHEYLPAELAKILQETRFKVVGLQLTSQNPKRWFRLVQMVECVK